MALGEFELIAKYFARPARRALLGVGDDCALLAPTPGTELAVSTDTLVEGRHFLSSVAPDRLGHKALAVNLSDLAACGAKPLAFLLAITLPRADEAFLNGFAQGMFTLADTEQIELIGGDTTAGPLSMTITVLGEVPAGQALRRDGARPGDQLWVSHGPNAGLGDARLALEVMRANASVVDADFGRIRLAMEMPQPRLALGQRLRGIASSAIDLSDGLIGDLGHVLERSLVGATIQFDSLPRSLQLAAQPTALQLECLLYGGDDYELLFTASPERAAAVREAARQAGVAATAVGVIESDRRLQVVDAKHRLLPTRAMGFDHFKASSR